MFIFVTVGILLFTALVLLILRFALPDFRFSWLTATGGALLAWVSGFVWQANMPAFVSLPLWQPETLFRQSPVFIADGVSWTFAISILTIGLGVIVTAVARENFPTPLGWVGVLILTALGVLAVTADNPLTLVLLWAAIDLTEIVAQMRFVEDPRLGERAVISFASRVTGILILLWASMVSASEGAVLDFLSAPSRAGLYLVVASAFRLGILPLHLPYASESSFRRGFGTALRMISAGSSLILLARAPLGGVESSISPYLVLFAAFAALYGAWMWLRSPDELTGRPYWLIGLGALAVASALRGNPLSATAWSCALILSGGALFLASAESRWLDRALLVGVWGISSLPFSLTASGWVGAGTFWYATPFLVVAQVMLVAGYIRQSQRSAARTSFDNQPIWAKNVYPFGIYFILLTILLLGFFGWNGALQLGSWIIALLAALLTFGLLWLIPRVRLLNPVRAHWVTSANESTWLDTVYQTVWELYRGIRRLTSIFSNVLEGESGVMWTLLFLALFISLFIQGAP